MDASSAHQDTLPVTSDQMLDRLRAAGLAFEYYEHAVLRTVEDAKRIQGSVLPMEAGHIDVKNFYLRDRKKRNYLVVLEQDRTVDLKALGAQIGAGNVSFGSPERLMEYLGVRPGAVTPLAMVTGAAKGVRLYMDRAVERAAHIHVHPLVNDRTVTLRSCDLLSLLKTWGATPVWLDL
ncbi:MAG: prolyl-tRNA synthetase associated domain-containing protein [Pseudomonadota bacterium]